MPKTGDVRVGMGWACAIAPQMRFPSTPSRQATETSQADLVQVFLTLLFDQRNGRAAFDQCVDLARFTGHLADGSYTALETLTRFQSFVDSSAQLTIRSVVIEAGSAFARVERRAITASEFRQHVMQLSISGGKIVDYFGSLEN